ncbi:MAG: hypothetical protein KJ052_13630 [Candidatus Hydrogenedentes bacterium]|nr:hypothetical protein [Candidatus Hydrogenedentota bacterium]
MLDPFTLFGLGISLIFAVQLARGKVDLSNLGDNTPPNTMSEKNPPERPPMAAPPPLPYTKDDEEEAMISARRPSIPHTTVVRSTRLMSEDEYKESAAELRRARGKKKP